MRTIIALILLAASFPASPVQLTQQDCVEMAVWSRDLVWARDMGADKEKVRRYLKDSQVETPFFTVILKTYDELWASKSDKVVVMQKTYQECFAKRGNYGLDT